MPGYCLSRDIFSKLLQKGCTETDEIEKLSKEEKQSNEGNRFSVPLYCEDLENPCNDPACQPYYDCEVDQYAMTALFSNINPTQLQQILNSTDSIAITNYFYPLANQVAAHLSIKYGDNISNEIGNNPQAMILLGLFEYGVENNFTLDSIANRAEYGDWECFMNAVVDGFGIGAVRTLYNDFKHGASPRTIVRAVKTLGSRMWLGLTVGWAIFSLGQCMDWW